MNLNLALQREIITELASRFVENISNYTKLYAVSKNWWREWCKYTNFQDQYFCKQLAKPSVSKSVDKLSPYTLNKNKVTFGVMKLAYRTKLRTLTI